MNDLLARVRRGEPLHDLDIVDIHGHLGRMYFAIPETDAGSLVGVLDRVGVASAVCSHIQCLGSRPDEGNRVLAQALRRHPGRILGYASLWPDGTAADLAERTRHWLDQPGFVGLKIHNSNGFPYDHPAYAGAFKEADRRRMLVLLHTWGREDEFAQIAVLGRRYPDIAFVLGHAGAAGREDEYARMARRHANVHLDTCLSACPSGLVERLVRAAGPEKVLFGSDVLFLNLPHQLGKIAGAMLPEKQWRMVLSGNARRLLGRVRPC